MRLGAGNQAIITMATQTNLSTSAFKSNKPEELCNMASHFSANQYENAFAAKRLQNWETPASFKERPSRLEGFTRPIANDRGHLLPGVPQSNKSPWGDFVGTWDHGVKSERKNLHVPKLSRDGSAEILTVHSPPPQSAGKKSGEKVAPSPIPEPFDEKDVGISKHINGLKQNESPEQRHSSSGSPLPEKITENC